ncbi:MAG: hypothetical protein R3B47_04720 [Bacteroidia bacterium]
MPKVLIIDDEDVIRSTLAATFQYEDYETEQAYGKMGLDLVLKMIMTWSSAIYKNAQTQRNRGAERPWRPSLKLPFIMISGHEIETAVEATKKGA